MFCDAPSTTNDSIRTWIDSGIPKSYVNTVDNFVAMYVYKSVELYVEFLKNVLVYSDKIAKVFLLIID